MNESPIRTFCESPHRRLIVAIVTTLLGLLVLIPLVDDYFDKQSNRSAITDELGRARQTAESLPKLEERVAKLIEELAETEARSVSAETVSEYRSTLVDMVRESGCQVRRIDVGAPSLRPWKKEGNPLAPAGAGGKLEKTPFTLERRNVVVLVDGPMQGILDLLEQLHEDTKLAYPRRLELNSKSTRGESVTMELELWLFALSRRNA